jgi:uncharacterized protein (TIGR03083 family)
MSTTAASPAVNGPVADNSPAGLTAQLAEVWGAVSALGHTLTPPEWELPTACPGWSVKDQVVHLIGTESMLAGRPVPEAAVGDVAHVRNDIGRFNEAWVVGLGQLDGPAVLAHFDQLSAERRATLGALDPAAWDEPGWTPVGQAPYRRFMQIRVFDCWVHLQDMLAALRHADGSVGGVDLDPATGSAPHAGAAILSGVDAGPAAQQSVDEVVRAIGLLVGKRAGAPTGSRVAITLTGPVERRILVAVDGRATLVDELDEPATVTLTTDSMRFVRLACGRVPQEQVEGAEGVVIDGDIELGHRIVAHLGFTV